MERRGLAPAAPRSDDDAEESRPFPAAPPMIEEIQPVRVEPPIPVAALADGKIAAELKRQQEMAERVRELEAAKRSRATMVATAVAEPADQSLPELLSRADYAGRYVKGDPWPPVGLR